MEKLFKLFGKRQPQTDETLSNQAEHSLANKALDDKMLTQVVGGTDDTPTDPIILQDDEVTVTPPVARSNSIDGIHPE